ncbi:MAG: ABC transporter permease [Microbacterium sp.]|uniref:ABC transporter permease n=1 Tax=Microbacterium sp. TaxID=51671 RepID=UPI0039E56393
MLRILMRRLVLSVPLVVVVSFLTFALVSLTPGDAVYTILGARATPEQVAQLRAELGLDQPLIVQYANWIRGAVLGDLGHSLLTGQPVTQAISQRLAPTLALIVGAIIVIAMIGVGLGLIAATRGGAVARAIDLLGFAGLAIPGFVLALYLIPFFAVQLRLVPVSGYVPFEGSPQLWFASLVLPVIAVSFGSVGLVAKQTRAAMDDVLSREFISMMIANGYRSRSIVYRHALKTAALPVVALLGVVTVGLLSASVLVESVFAFPGLGGLAVQASSQSDLTLVVGVTVAFTLIVVIINVLVDLTYVLLNSKIRTV